MDAKDLIVPIPVRGVIRTREEKIGRAFPEVPTLRGGPLFLARFRPRPVLKIPIQGLLAELRQESGSIPLSVIVYGWGGQEAMEFVSVLRPYLLPEEALVLFPIPSDPIDASATQAPEGSVVMNLNHPSHKRVYENGSLIGDIVFMSAADPSEIEKWKSSVRAVIVSHNVASAKAVLAKAREMNRVGYLWNGEDVQRDES
jgi:hypothetical protein